MYIQDLDFGSSWNAIQNMPWNICLEHESVEWFLFFFAPPVLPQIQDGSWHQSRFFFHTQDSRQLPIVHIQDFPTSQPSRQQHVEVGPVCFLWHQPHPHVWFTQTTKMQGFPTPIQKKWLPTDTQVFIRFCHGNQSNICLIEGRRTRKNSISVEHPGQRRPKRTAYTNIYR